MRTKRIFFTKCLAALALGVASVPITAVAQSRTWYHVEVVVFEYLEPKHVDGEQWQPEILPLALDGVLELFEEIPEFDDDSFSVEPDTHGAPAVTEEMQIPMAFQRLKPDDFELLEVAERLMRAPNQRLLLHVAWRQPRYGMRSARAVHIRRPLFEGLQEPGVVAEPEQFLNEDGLEQASPSSAEGVLRLRSGRQLHIDADFRYRHEDIAVHLTETRRVRLRELHYLDHPLFGLLVSVIPFIVESPSMTGADAGP